MKLLICMVALNSWTMNASRTGATQYHAVGVMYTLLPVINRFYKTKEERAEALVRHTTWFNATMHINNFTRKMPQKKESPMPESGPISEALTAVIELASKFSSSLFCFSIEATSPIMIGISLASTGSPLGAIVFLLLYNVPAFLIHYYALYSGYSTRIVLNFTFEAVILPIIIKPSILDTFVSIFIPPDSYIFWIKLSPIE
jgi:PTS system mannose-specific IID component